MGHEPERTGHVQPLADLARNGAEGEPGLVRVRVERDNLDLARTWSIIGLFTIAVLTVVYTMSAVLMPITLAVIVGLILGLLADKLHKLGVPPILSAILLSSLFGLGVFLIVNALAEPVANLAQNAPDLVEGAVQRIMPYLQRIEWLRITPASFNSGPVSMEGLLTNTGSILQLLAAGLTPALVQALIFFAALLLFLMGRLQLRKALIMTFRHRDKRLTAIRILNAIEQALGFYFATAALVYASIGGVVTVIAYFGGLSMPVLWGVFAFISSFVPYLGFALMTLSLGAAGILSHDTLFIGVLPALAFFSIHLVTENLVIPAVMGKRLEMNPFIIFVAIIFWSWMWGAVGAMLALPLSLIVMTIINETLPDDRPMPQLPG